MNYSKLPYYILFLCLFIAAQSLSMWGQYVTLPYKNLSMWEAYKMAIPFAWLDWIFMTFAIMVGDKYELVTPTQDTFLLIIIQFCLILFGFFVSFSHLISKIVNIVVPIHKDETPIHEKFINQKPL